MTQSVNLVVEYAQGISVLLDGLMIVLLFVALRRMKRIIKLSQVLIGEEKGGQADDKKLFPERENLTAEELDALLLNEPKMGVEKVESSVCPEVLLAEVLDEVFP